MVCESESTNPSAVSRIQTNGVKPLVTSLLYLQSHHNLGPWDMLRSTLLPNGAALPGLTSIGEGGGHVL
jgi:hypothetical protein